MPSAYFISYFSADGMKPADFFSNKLNMCKYKNIYVIAPFNYATGGVELCHQLVDYLRNKGQKAYIVYEHKGVISEDQSITKAYNKYNIKSTSIIDDSPENILVLPEISCDFIFQFHYIQMACWWMSVNNHYFCSDFWECLKFQNDWITRTRMIKQFLFDGEYRYKNKISDLKAMGSKLIHLYQSHYAQYHLYKLGMHKVLPLSDYINCELLTRNPNIDKEDVILYNPSKGYRFTRKILKKMPNYHFVALQGFNREQLNEIMDKAKLYIDFGEFPGKDRLPREAALHDCCIITGRQGASFFYEDMPINDSYKFDAKSKNLDAICSSIENVIINYESCIGDFSDYRNLIRNEQKIFNSQIDSIFL